jgi:hypothetical protein
MGSHSSVPENRRQRQLPAPRDKGNPLKDIRSRDKGSRKEDLAFCRAGPVRKQASRKIDPAVNSGETPAIQETAVDILRFRKNIRKC